MMRLIVAAALATAGAAPAKPDMSLAAAIAVCRTTFFIEPAKGRAMFAAVADEDKPVVAALCLAYRQGALDMRRSMGSQEEGK